MKHYVVRVDEVDRNKPRWRRRRTRLHRRLVFFCRAIDESNSLIRSDRVVYPPFMSPSDVVPRRSPLFAEAVPLQCRRVVMFGPRVLGFTATCEALPCSVVARVVGRVMAQRGVVRCPVFGVV